MKTIISFWLLLTSISAFPSNVFSLGGESFQLCFLKSGYSEEFKSFVTEDVERIFAPLRSISNVVDVVSFQTHPEQCCRLIHHEGYPEHFFGSFSISNANGALVFLMDEAISEKYKQAYTEYESKSNQVAQLNALLDSINSGAITNSPAEAFLTLVFLPDGFGADVTPDKARNLILSSLEHAPISASILDYWEQTVDGEPRLMAASKTVVADALETTLEPICWIYLNESWKFCHPAILRSLLTHSD